MTDPRIVLVHGSMDSSASFRATAALLDGCTVLTYDRRGYGSALCEGTPDLPGHVDDLLKVLDGTPSVVAGHSLGGVIALAAAVREPGLVRAALVYEPPMPWQPWWPGPSLPSRRDAPDEEARRAAEGFLRRHLGERWDRLPPDRREGFLRSAPAWAAELWSAAHDPAPFEPGQVTVPVVVAYGTATDDRHARSAKELAERIPDARLETVEAGDHTAHRRRPAEFAGLVRRAVERSEHGR
ncbi:alpha/beta hydrolase [Amycolatopsis acidicola]|uniref:Alpha/beta hydrolase n=1 Tax=Amycolatopsis acidicola TaxID=2596893 RepID=A0A5N0VG93_9PSEU|nr:alpha/beta hydrolase [Amycolatopsis acidicola]KAA9164413.1 alpha/beta hydrolase [Amycolatopsis acidicola]